MAKIIRPSDVFPIKPAVSALALAFGGMASANEHVQTQTQTQTLPEIKIKAEKTTARSNEYKVDESASQKFTAPLIDTPKSITIITDEVIKDSGSLSFQDALRTTPGITFGGGEGGIAAGDRPFIRGFDVFSSIYVDGLRDLGTQVREIFAVEQMEVLKGPSGSFDGRGSAGGSINIVTKQARAGNFIRGAAGGGTDDFIRGTFDGNYTIHENVAVRLVGMAHKADTPGRDNVDVQRWGLMPSITLGLNTPTSATVSWYHFETDDRSDWGVPYIQNAENGGIPEGKPVGSRSAWYGVKGRDFHDTSADIGTFKLSHAFNENLVVRNTTRFGITTNEFFVGRPNISSAQFAAGIVDRSASRNRGTRTETIANLTDVSAKFDTGFIKHSLNAGFEVSWEDYRNRTYAGGAITNPDDRLTPLGNPNPSVAFDPVTRNPYPGTEAEAHNKSAYIFDSMELTEKILLNAGIRFDNYQIDLQNRNANTGENTAAFKQDKNFFNYQVGAVYKMLPNANVYAAFATSSSPVGLSMGDFAYAGGDLTTNTQNLKPERTETYEVGTKWHVLHDLALTAAVFHTVKTNARVNVGPFIENAGEAVVNGFEFGFAGNITDKWNVFGGYTFLDAEQTKVGDSTDQNAVGSASSKGKQLHGTPKHAASVWSTYQILPRVTFGGGLFYTGKVYADPSNNGYIPSYVRFDLMAKYNISQNFDVQVNIQNLTNTRYFNTTYFRHYAIPAPGRFAFVNLNYRF
ncbi:MAG: TonB-dependent siderophore receptor [Nitrosomonas sp.]|nr:TonB-dependent siderophore receptor [Nitrosomonas sp.]MCW5606472.1 TonB-dependent siderophore receptor [Nitrosomonas sp.]